jgi:hypothetical protein
MSNNTADFRVSISNEQQIWEEKVGWDSANKRMIAKVYQSLYYVLQHSILKPSWVNVVRLM